MKAEKNEPGRQLALLDRQQLDRQQLDRHQLDSELAGWRLDRQTREVGRRGVAAAREVLRSAGRPSADSRAA